MKKILLTIFFLTIVSFTTLAQNNSVGFGFGINDFHLRDNYTSPYNFNGTMFQSHLFYKHVLDENIHSVIADFSKGTLSAKTNNEETTQYFGELSYSYSHVIYTIEVSGNPMKFFVGAGVSTLFLINDNFTEQGITWYGPVDKTWYWSHSINIETGGIFSLGNLRTLTLRVGSPLYRSVSRPDPAHHFSRRNIDAQDNFLNSALKGKPEFIWDNIMLSCNIEYVQQLKENLTLNASYGFYYTSSDEPLTMKTYMNIFLVGLGITF